MQKYFLWNFWYVIYSIPIFNTAGAYYTSVRALNKVEYGGPLSTTVCHTTPYVIDITKPEIYEIFNIRYDEDFYVITAEHNSRYSQY